MAGLLSEVTFHHGSIYEESAVVKIARYGGASLIITKRTPFHPRDYQWPDQPADKGALINAARKRYAVTDAVFAAVDENGGLFADQEIPVKKGEPGWFFCVGHVLDGDSDFSEGDKITLEVDGGYREALSRVHSVTHVMALALNKSLAPLWQKNAPQLDALGSPDFDGLAMAQSEMGTEFCTDRYRLGKSLRKKGFSASGLKDALKECEDKINRQIAEWLTADTAVVIRAADGILSSRRFWHTEIAGSSVEIPCGGTHVRSLSEIGTVKAEMTMPDDETLIIITSAAR